MSATPIVQHTLCKYETYAIINNNVRIPMNPRYLTPLLKDDNRLITSYTSDVIESVMDKEYARIGDLEFTISIEVVEKEVSAKDFLDQYIIPRGNYKNVEDLTKLISIASCSKGLLLSVYYMLYYADDDDIIDLSFLDNIDSMNEADLYNVVLNTMENLYLEENPIKYEDYIPTIEVDEMDVYSPHGDSDTYKYNSNDELIIGTHETSTYRNTIDLNTTDLTYKGIVKDEIVYDDVEINVFKKDKDANLISSYIATDFDSDNNPTRWTITINNGMSSNGNAFGYWNKTRVNTGNAYNYTKQHILFKDYYYDEYDNYSDTIGKLMTITKDGVIRNNTTDLTIILPAGTRFMYKYRFKGTNTNDDTYEIPYEVKIEPGDVWKMPNGLGETSNYESRYDSILNLVTMAIMSGQPKEWACGSFEHSDSAAGVRMTIYVERVSRKWWSEYKEDLELGNIRYTYDESLYTNESRNIPFSINNIQKTKALTFYAGSTFGGSGYIKNNTELTKIHFDEIILNAEGMKLIQVTKNKVIDVIITKVVEIAYTVFKTIQTIVTGIFNWFKGLFTKEETVATTEYRTETITETEQRTVTYTEYERNLIHHTIIIRNIDILPGEMYRFGATYTDNSGKQFNFDEYSTCTISFVNHSGFGESAVSTYDFTVQPASDSIGVNNTVLVQDAKIKINSILTLTPDMFTTSASGFGYTDDKKKVYVHKSGSTYLVDFYTNMYWSVDGASHNAIVQWQKSITKKKYDQLTSATSNGTDPLSKMFYFSSSNGNNSYIKSLSFRKNPAAEIESVNKHDGKVSNVTDVRLLPVWNNSTASYDFTIQTNKIIVSPANTAFSSTGNISITNKYILDIYLKDTFIKKIGNLAARDLIIPIKQDAIDTGFVWDNATNETVVDNVLYHINNAYSIINNLKIKFGKPDGISDDLLSGFINFVRWFFGAEISNFNTIKSDVMFMLENTDIHIYVPEFSNTKPYVTTTFVDIITPSMRENNCFSWNTTSTEVLANTDIAHCNVYTPTAATPAKLVTPITEYELYYYNGSIYKRSN